MSTPDLIWHPSCLTLLDESPKRKTTKILNLQIQQMKAPKQIQNPPNFCYYCKKPGHWKRVCYKFKHLGAFAFQPAFPMSPNSQLRDSEKSTGLFSILLLNQLGGTFLHIGDKSLPGLIDTRATLLVINATTIKQPLPRSSKEIATLFSLVPLPLPTYQAETSLRSIMPEFLYPQRGK